MNIKKVAVVLFFLGVGGTLLAQKIAPCSLVSFESQLMCVYETKTFTGENFVPEAKKILGKNGSVNIDTDKGKKIYSLETYNDCKVEFIVENGANVSAYMRILDKEKKPKLLDPSKPAAIGNYVEFLFFKETQYSVTKVDFGISEEKDFDLSYQIRVAGGLEQAGKYMVEFYENADYAVGVRFIKIEQVGSDGHWRSEPIENVCELEF